MSGYDRAAIQTLYRGTRFRSRLEATWAAFFDRLGWGWTYEPMDRDGWIPDFALDSLLHRPRPVLVEVKPISGFDPEVAGKIERADDEHEVLLLGISLLQIEDGPPVIGFLREIPDGDWSPAVMGSWAGACSELKNPRGLLGFCPYQGDQVDRITGCADGALYGSQKCDPLRLERDWAAAKNAVRWEPRSARLTSPVPTPPRRTFLDTSGHDLRERLRQGILSGDRDLVTRARLDLDRHLNGSFCSEGGR